MTVGELINELGNYSADDKIVMAYNWDEPQLAITADSTVAIHIGEMV